MCTSVGRSRSRRSATGTSQRAAKSLDHGGLISADARADGVVDLPRKGRPLTSDRMGIDGKETIGPHPTGPALVVPGSCSDGKPVRITRMVAARDHEHGEPPAISEADDDDRAILADGGIFLESNPPPHDLPRIRSTIALGSVCPADPTGVGVRTTGSRLSRACRTRHARPRSVDTESD